MTLHHISVGPINQHKLDESTRYFHRADIIEGIAFRLETYESPPIVAAFTTINAYHVEATGREYWLIGRPRTIGALVPAKQEEVDNSAVFLAAFGCLCLNGPPAKIVLAIRAHDSVWTRTPPSFGLRELTAREVDEMPRSIRKQALAHWRIGDHTGLYCPDQNNLSSFAAVAAELLHSATVSFSDNRNLSGTGAPLAWAIEAGKLLRALQTIETVGLEIGRIHPSWPHGETEARLCRWSGSDAVDGLCLRLWCDIDGESMKLCRARGYQIMSQNLPITTSSTWWVLSDLLIHNLARDQQLRNKLIVARVLVFALLGTPLSQIVLPRGLCRNYEFGTVLRDLELSELESAPREILKFSADSREAQPELRTGLACPNELNHDEFSVLAEKITNDEPITIHGAVKPVTLRCGNILKTCLNEGRLDLAHFGWRVRF